MTVSGAFTLTGSETRLDPVIRNDPFPFYRAMRAQDPVYYDPGLDVYLVTRHADAVQVLRDDVNFSLEHGYQDRFANGHVEEFAAILDAHGGGFIRDLAVDPPRHTRLRRLTEKAFTAHRVKGFTERMRAIVIDLITPLGERGHGDGMADIGAPLTAQIICEQLGLDFAEVGTERLARWTTAVIAQIGRMQTREEMIANAHVICDLQNAIIKQIDARRAAPREDMISDLIHAKIDGEEGQVLSYEEAIATVRAFLIAGNDTTAAAIANLLFVLATREGLVEELYPQIDDERVMNRFVDELVRLHPPVHGLFRTAMRDVEVGGTVIPAMAQVCIMYASANHDDAVFAAPEAFDMSRSNLGANLTFGAGIHRCIGIALARSEIKIAAQEIVRHLTQIRLAIPREELTYLPTLATQTLTRLPLTFRLRGA